ncbi:MAG: putative rane protein [Bryobacterales bacterium]|nr:putative rane protein [Bryobacterales bacterium]
MASPEQERLDALSEAILRLLRWREATEQRLARIEQALGIVTAGEETARAPEPPRETVAPVITPTAAPPALPALPVQPRAPESDRPREFETQVGLTWISRIGAVTLMFGVAFIFKYAIDNQWIGERGRIMLGVLAGLACLEIGDRIWRSGQHTYAQAISGLGIAILYLSFYASFAFYHLLPQAWPFILMAVTTVVSAALALRYAAPAIAALGLIGGYLTPVLLSTGVDRPAVLFGYIMLLDVGAVTLVRVRRWRGFEVLAFVATAFLYWTWFATHFAAEKEIVAAVFALLFYALFLLAGEPLVLLASQVLTAAALAAIWPSNPTPFLATMTAVAAAGLAAADLRRRPILAPIAMGAFWLVYAAWYAGFPGQAPVGMILPFLTVAFLLFFVWTPWRALARNAALQSSDFVVLSLNTMAYYSAAYNLLARDYHAYLGLFTVGLAGLYLALATELRRRLAEQRGDTRPVLLSLGIALTLLTLAIPVQFTGYRITIGWAAEAAALTWIGKRGQNERLVAAAACVFALVLWRLLIIDSWMYPQPTDYSALWNSRFLTFAAAVVSLWASAYWMRSGKAALPAYIAGHVVLLWGLMLEVTGWAQRTADPQNVANLESTAMSIVMAVYALLLIGAGVGSRTLVNRVMGLGLIGLVIVKLYVYDVWQLVRIYRIVAFAALGALLLITSYLYSRYREKIEALWRDEVE